mmetsp:Transcript_11243/g.12364  ORF Transcript_11243/g.12364 Transcript_11243/m.12364 type:complete len:202 (+) Transcript_11243:176-781(+)
MVEMIRAFDAQGLDMESGFTNETRLIISRQLAGCKEGLELCDLKADHITEVSANFIHIPIVIISAVDILVVTGKRITPACPPYLLALNEFLYEKRGFYPPVVVTNMDRIEEIANDVDSTRIIKAYAKTPKMLEKLIEQLKETIKSVCHNSTITYLSCWSQAKTDNPTTYQHSSKVVDIVKKATSVCVRVGRHRLKHKHSTK